MLAGLELAEPGFHDGNGFMHLESKWDPKSEWKCVSGNGGAVVVQLSDLYCERILK